MPCKSFVLASYGSTVCALLEKSWGADIVTQVQCLDNWLTDTQGDSNVCKSVRFICCKVIVVSHHETEPHFIFITASPSFCNHPSIHLLSPSSSLGSRGKKYDRLLPTLPSGETCGSSQYCVKAPFSTDVPLRQRLRSEWGEKWEGVPEMLASDRDGWS